MTPILIVDDDAHLRNTLSDILKIKGHHAVAVATGRAALSQIETEKPVVALIDLKLDDMPGLEVMREVKRRSPDTECIVLTGHASQSSAIEAINLGAYSYVQKPYDVDQLLVTIRRAVEKQEALEAIRQLNADLEERVAKRTADLRKLVNAMAGREVRMAELKKVIKKLQKQLQDAGLEPVAGDPLIEGLAKLE